MLLDTCHDSTYTGTLLLYRLSRQVCVRGPTLGIGLGWGRGVIRTIFGNLRLLSFWKKIAFFCRTTKSAPKLALKKGGIFGIFSSSAYYSYEYDLVFDSILLPHFSTDFSVLYLVGKGTLWTFIFKNNIFKKLRKNIQKS